MAKIYRPTYRKIVGGETVTRTTAKWYGRIKIGGRWKAVPLTTDKRASEIMLADLLRKSAMGSVGAVDPFAAPNRVALTSHVADWQADLRYRDSSEKHVVAAGKLLGRYLDAAGAIYPPHATPESVTRFLANHKVAGHSPRTVNWTANTVKAFFAWMVRENRMAANPASGIVRLNESADVRRRRRPLTGDEPGRLIAAADGSELVFRGMAGIDRGTLYVVAMATGFRAAELASLTVDSLRIDAPTPVVILAADVAKNRAEAVQPLPTFAVTRLRTIRAAGQLFPGTWHERAAKMLRHDLEAAGIAESVGGRVVDFHSLRHTFVASLRQSGVELGDAMKLARHSDPKLTLAIYGQSDLVGLADAVNRVPALHGLDTTFGTNANECERLCAAGGEAAHLYNAPESATILAFSADLRDDMASTPGEARTHNLPLRRRQSDDANRPQIQAETNAVAGGLTPACEISDHRRAAILAAYDAGDEGIRSALYAVATRKIARAA